MQYTIRQIPQSVDRALRARAKSQGKSLNETTVEVLREAMLSDRGTRHHDLSDLVGSMTPQDARAVEQSVAEADKADVRSQTRAKH